MRRKGEKENGPRGRRRRGTQVREGEVSTTASLRDAEIIVIVIIDSEYYADSTGTSTHPRE